MPRSRRSGRQCALVCCNLLRCIMLQLIVSAFLLTLRGGGPLDYAAKPTWPCAIRLNPRRSGTPATSKGFARAAQGQRSATTGEGLPNRARSFRASLPLSCCSFAKSTRSARTRPTPDPSTIPKFIKAGEDRLAETRLIPVRDDGRRWGRRASWEWGSGGRVRTGPGDACWHPIWRSPVSGFAARGLAAMPGTLPC